MKLAARIAFLVGLGAMLVLIAHEGALDIARLISRAGWVLLWLVPLHALPLALDASGWRALIQARVKLALILWIAAIRQAINNLLPVASIGGEIVGIRLLNKRGIDSVTAASSVIVEVLLTVVGQYLFVALGVVLLLTITQAVELRKTLLLALAAGAPLVGLLIAVLRNSLLFERLELMAARLLGPDVHAAGLLKGGANLDAAIRELCRRHSRLARSLAWQFLGLIAEGVETWAALYCLGLAIEFSHALVLESLTQAARRFLFIVPAALGVQEVSLVAVGHVLGISSDLALALSLTKRMIGIVFGLPALLSWHWLETRLGLRNARG